MHVWEERGLEGASTTGGVPSQMHALLMMCKHSQRSCLAWWVISSPKRYCCGVTMVNPSDATDSTVIQ